MRIWLLALLLLATSCGGRLSKPYARTPAEPEFLVKGSFTSNGRFGTLWLDTRQNRARYDMDDETFLKAGGPGFTLLLPKEKVCFVYDKAREEALSRARKESQRSRYYMTALQSGGLALHPAPEDLLAHPCERAVIRLGAHADCEHTDGAEGRQSWHHACTRRSSLQDGFKETTTTLANEYEPRRGLILSESYQSDHGSGSHSFEPGPDEVRPEDFERPDGYREILTDADLEAQALPSVGDAAMLPGGIWQRAENYHEDYPAGSLDPQFSVTRERWYRGDFGKPQHEEVLIWRLHAYRDLGLQKKGVLGKMNLEHRLSDKFVNPQADPPGKDPFPLKENAWCLVGPRYALYVRVVPEKSRIDPRDLLLRLSRRPL